MNTPSSEALSLLEYRLQAVRIGGLALQHAMGWEAVPTIEILFDGQLVIEGRATAFTNCAIESAIVHSRALLEFLGLAGKSQTELRQITSRKKSDDIAIEQFDGVSKVSIHEAVRSYPGPAAQAEAALAYVIYLANKGLAHTTSSFAKHDEGTELLKLAFGGVVSLMISKFYDPLNLSRPKHKLPSRRRAA
jgi:hypothetical protein